jgi:hypothetical protein
MGFECSVMFVAFLVDEVRDLMGHEDVYLNLKLNY